MYYIGYTQCKQARHTCVCPIQHTCKMQFNQKLGVRSPASGASRGGQSGHSRAQIPARTKSLVLDKYCYGTLHQHPQPILYGSWSMAGALCRAGVQTFNQQLKSCIHCLKLDTTPATRAGCISARCRSNATAATSTATATTPRGRDYGQEERTSQSEQWHVAKTRIQKFGSDTCSMRIAVHQTVVLVPPQVTLQQYHKVIDCLLQAQRPRVACVFP